MNENPSCPLCRRAASPLEMVADHFFGSSGVWHYWRCTSADCGVAFPAPAPTDAELAIAYSSYYTHEEGGSTSLPGWLEARISSVVRAAPAVLGHIPLIGWLAEQLAWELGGLKPQAGLVVDIGAGDGARLTRLRRAGWGRAVGVEPDPAAVSVAQQSGADMRLGSAEAVPLEDGVAQAALMHHVIEHVRDPRKAFSEAFRILKKGGELSIATPNIESVGRARWGAFWRGFEAPRHLTIFSASALGDLAREAGFEIVCNRSSARSAAWVDEVSGGAAGRPPIKSGKIARLLRADAVFRRQGRERDMMRGEEIILIARKP